MGGFFKDTALMGLRKYFKFSNKIRNFSLFKQQLLARHAFFPSDCDSRRRS